MQVQQLGALRARITGGDDGRGGGDGPVVVLMHGYGAEGDDLVPLAHFLPVPSRVRFVFPEAPIALPSGGRAWWPLDLERLARRARGEQIDRSAEQPAELPEVSARVDELLQRVYAQLGVGPARVLLGGFSQGSMVACDVALHAADKPRGLILLSSTLIARPRWEPCMASLSGVPVLQTHGTLDPLLPHVDALKLADLLRAHGAALEFVGFPGGHELPEVVLQRLTQFITAQLG